MKECFRLSLSLKRMDGTAAKLEWSGLITYYDPDNYCTCCTLIVCTFDMTEAYPLQVGAWVLLELNEGEKGVQLQEADRTTSWGG